MHGVSVDPELRGDGPQGPPSSLSCRMVYHRAFWGCVEVGPVVIGALLVTYFPASDKTVVSPIRTGSKAATRRCWDLLWRIAKAILAQAVHDAARVQ